MSFAYLTDALMSKSTSGVSHDLQKAIDHLGKLYTLTGSEEFKKQSDSLIQFVKNLPDEKCIAWAINKSQFDIQPTPLPKDTMYGLLQLVASEKGEHSKSPELFRPQYTLKLFQNYDEGKRTEEASLLQCRNVFNRLGMTSSEDMYYPTLYKVTFESIESS